MDRRYIYKTFWLYKHESLDKNILATDISVDGTLLGPNINIYKKILKDKKINLIASGGIGSIDDIYKLKQISANECVVGKAIYENKILLEDLKMLTKRIIPCLDVKNGSVVKGVKFKNHEIVGSIIDLATKYNEEVLMSWFFMILVQAPMMVSSQKNGLNLLLRLSIYPSALQVELKI